ncbi:acetolactate synthase large subunit [Sphingomonas sp. GB1N7]|uniref:acetolactate synthase large subunit n=1 Tax=Parasphingomonas caseinilytica TaxID=3096158 RepID=UPI002FC9EBD5
MNGARALLSTLVLNKVTVCFANPGTSEMQFVAALDAEPQMRSVLCLFEGVATGAADGYGRMADTPACTLLHLGPGYANGAANLHNARRAFTPVVNVIGDHATYHRQYDAPLNSDIAALAKPNSLWVESADTPDSVAPLAAAAITASYGAPGGPVSLILPADSAWLPTVGDPVVAERPVPAAVPMASIEGLADAIQGAAKPVVLLGGRACLADSLVQAARFAAAEIPVYSDTFVPRQPRGEGAFLPRKMPYFGEMALAELAGVDLLVLVGTSLPVSFFAYPDRPSVLVPEGCRVETLADRWQNAPAALAALADAISAPAEGPVQALALPDAPSGALNSMTAGVSIARHMPENAILCDDAVTSGAPIMMATATARRHDVLALTGGAIGIGLPIAIGAAIARPDSKVFALSGDGAAMYTVQSLWTMAREALDIVIVIFANHSYRILTVEMSRTGAGDAGPAAADLLGLDKPKLDWVALAQGHGVPAVRCETAAEFDAAVANAVARRGPMLIEAAI